MSLQNYFQQYEKAHQNAANRLCHAVGIPLILISILILAFTSKQSWGLSLFTIGWLFQFIGHAIERSWPEFIRNPIFLAIGPLYFLNKLKTKFY